MKNKRGRKDAFGDRDSLTAYTPPKSLEKSQSELTHQSRDQSQNASAPRIVQDGMKMNMAHYQLQ